MRKQIRLIVNSIILSVYIIYIFKQGENFVDYDRIQEKHYVFFFLISLLLPIRVSYYLCIAFISVIIYLVWNIGNSTWIEYFSTLIVFNIIFIVIRLFILNLLSIFDTNRVKVQLTNPAHLYINLKHLMTTTFNILLKRNEIWTFDNNIKMYQKQFIGMQLNRYNENNLHEPTTERYFLKILKKYPDSTFLDIGAAGGYYSILAKLINKSRKVIPVNPHPKFQKFLKDNFKLNNLVTPKQIAVAIGKNKGTKSLSGGWGSRIGDSGILVKVDTLSSIVRNIQEKMIIKLDIQGEELDGIKSLKNEDYKKILAFIIETHSPSNHEDIESILKEKKYKIIISDTNSGLLVAVKT